METDFITIRHIEHKHHKKTSVQYAESHLTPVQLIEFTKTIKKKFGTSCTTKGGIISFNGLISSHIVKVLMELYGISEYYIDSKLK